MTTSGRKQRNFAVPGDFSGRRSVNTNQQKLSSNYYLPHTFPLDGAISATATTPICRAVAAVQFPHPVIDGVRSLLVAHPSRA